MEDDGFENQFSPEVIREQKELFEALKKQHKQRKDVDQFSKRALGDPKRRLR